MTDLSTSNLKRLLNETTPGPWEARGYYMDGEPRPDDSRQIHGTGGGYLGMMHGTDSHLAALAPELAQEVLRMREQLQDLADAMYNKAKTGHIAKPGAVAGFIEEVILRGHDG